MKEMVGRIEAMDLEADTRAGCGVEETLQSLDVGCLLYRVDEALVPNPGGTRRIGHFLHS
jgi:hypothetical protein